MWKKEANCLADLYRNSEAFGASFRDEVKNLSVGYARAVTGDEWKHMARGGSSALAQAAFNKLFFAYMAYSPSTERERIFFTESIRKLNDLSELRRTRLSEARAGIHPVLRFVLLVGALATIIFTFFFGSENPKAQVLMTMLLAIVISLVLYTIMMFDYPFTGDVNISPETFNHIFSF
ncbi:MAG: DUF4239 domain-containing protein [Candidatus Omnitrophica bacterium]|nr:DUF4239 domain-containing protein [Candidatus Omnitrophota bacterium]MCM8791246.1 DUF4239 domain-containing protein [Candidatus Omnitrophota bacterium]